MWFEMNLWWVVDSLARARRALFFFSLELSLSIDYQDALANLHWAVRIHSLITAAVSDKETDTAVM